MVEPVPACEVILITGDRYEVEGTPDEVEKKILGAARGSIMELAWLTETESQRPIGLNPVHIVAVRAAEA
jgi:uncharacterized protein YlzI (FlbEa/FlbD family)